MQNYKIEGCGGVQKWLLSHELSKLSISFDNFEIIYHQEFEHGKYDSVWYIGDMASIRYAGYEFLISVDGDVIMTLKNKADGSEVIHIKDKYYSGLFYQKMRKYIRNDAHLNAILNGEDEQYTIRIIAINCYMLYLNDSSGTKKSLCELEGSYIHKAIAEAIKVISESINNF